MIGSIINALSNLGQMAFVNQRNKENVDATNAANIKMVQMQNQAAKQESELAYNRSKASNQVSLMQSAGMSKAGAINAINGGGSYTPAPVNTAQSTASQMQPADLSSAFNGLLQVGENAKQRKLQKDLQKEQFKENAKQRSHDLLIKDIETANQTQHDYLDYEKHKESLDFNKRVYADAAPMRDVELDILRQNYKNLQVDETTKRLNNDLLGIQKQLLNETYNYKVLRERAESLTLAAKGELERLQAGKLRTALLTMDPDELNAYMHYKARVELCAMLGDAIKDDQFNKNITDNKVELLKLLDDLLTPGR